MFASLPADASQLTEWTWPEIEPYFSDLAARELSAENVDAWLADWTRISELFWEAYSRLYVATTVDTTDEGAQGRFNAFLENVYPQVSAADQKLKEKLLASGIEPAGFAVPLRNLRAEAELFREENLALFVEERKFSNEYERVIGAQTVVWNGEEKTIAQLLPIYQHAERPERERAWRLAATRQLADREAVNALWKEQLALRRKIAANAGYPDYRAFRWQQLLRFDYTPDDCERFHAAIEEVVVPAAARLYERSRQRLGLDALRPWDLKGPQGASAPVDPPGLPPLKPFASSEQLITTSLGIFERVDPELGEYFRTMVHEELLDLDNRKGKAPGGYCTNFAAAKRPFIFMNAVGVHDDVQTLLHEAGHAFHVFESNGLRYFHQRDVGAEFSEVASMGMELLASPYLANGGGGFYSAADAARARAEHLRGIILFWPYMAVVDAFQHWVYTHADDAADPEACDAQWAALWERFMRGVDWSGLDQEKRTGWHRKLHIQTLPFYYVEYGLASLGAVQVWRNALRDQAGAVRAYRRALALGGTVPFPELFAAAGARFAFDAEILGMAVEQIENTLAELEDTV